MIGLKGWRENKQPEENSFFFLPVPVSQLFVKLVQNKEVFFLPYRL